MLKWAAERARLAEESLVRRFRKWRAWLSGDAHPTLRQLEDFARLTHIPFGYFFLPEPPTVNLPVADLLMMRDEPVAQAVQRFARELKVRTLVA